MNLKTRTVKRNNELNCGSLATYQYKGATMLSELFPTVGPGNL